MKISNKAVVVCMGVLLAAVACTDTPSSQPRSPVTAAGDASYGGLFRMNMSEDIRSIFPHGIVDAAAFNIMNQVYEGLVRIDRKTKEVIPALAERYEVSADGKVYRFYLRQGVKFHGDPVFVNDEASRELKAEDVAYCFRKLCEPSDENELYAFAIDIIKGADKHYQSGEKGIKATNGPEGIRVLSDYVLELELEFPMPNFLTVLTHPCFWIFPKELYNYGKDVDNWSIGTGPFMARTVKLNDVIILERNRDYWKVDAEGNPLPYLDAIRCNFIHGHKEQMNSFLEGYLDLLVQVPYDEIEAIEIAQSSGDISKEFSILTSPGLRVEYYGFQHRSADYSNEYVRKAFNYAIDRQFLVDTVMKGYGIPATHGFVPQSMPGFDAESVKGFSYEPDTARLLMAMAGFPGGNGFPVVTIQLNDGNETALAVAEEVQRMLAQTLGITVELAVLQRSRHYDQIEQGRVDFWRDGWIADYPDPENFLKLFHGKLVPEDSVRASFLNTIRFKNEAFDGYFEKALRTTNKEERMVLLAKADQEVINNAAVIPLYYEKWIWLKASRVENLTVGQLGELDLTRVYIRNADAGAQ
jgi:peptide/nickel transport system substrate-binding protein